MIFSTRNQEKICLYTVLLCYLFLSRFRRRVQGLRDWQPEKRVPVAYAGRGLGTNEPREVFFVVTVTVLNDVSHDVLNYVDCFIFMKLVERIVNSVSCK